MKRKGLRRGAAVCGLSVLAFAGWFLTNVLPAAGPHAAAAAQQTGPCPAPTSTAVEDFTDNANPSNPGLDGNVFTHSITGPWGWASSIGCPTPTHALFLFAGATDVVTLHPASGQSVESASVRYNPFGGGRIIFEGATGETRSFQISPSPGCHLAAACSTDLGDNGVPLGAITRVTLIGAEVIFDDLELGLTTNATPTPTPQPTPTPTPAATPTPTPTPTPMPPSGLQVNVLVRPTSINPDRNAMLIKMVILTDESFDAANVVPTSVRFGAAATPFRSFPGDEDEDGDSDLIFFFNFVDVGVRCGDTFIPVSGQTVWGQPISGIPAIRTVGCTP